jgi:hypothetical protein
LQHCWGWVHAAPVGRWHIPWFVVPLGQQKVFWPVVGQLVAEHTHVPFKQSGVVPVHTAQVKPLVPQVAGVMPGTQVPLLQH